VIACIVFNCVLSVFDKEYDDKPILLGINPLGASWQMGERFCAFCIYTFLSHSLIDQTS